MSVTPERPLPTRPAPPPPVKVPRPPPRAHNHYVKTSAKMSNTLREGERDLQAELERRRIGTLSPEPHLEVMRPVSPFQNRRPSPIFHQQPRQPSPAPYQSQPYVTLNTQTNAYPGSSRVQGTSAPGSNATDSYTNAGQRADRIVESRDGWGSGSRGDADAQPAAVRRHEVWTSPSSSAEDGRSNQSHSTRDTHQTRVAELSRSSSPETPRKRDKIRRKPVPVFVPTPPQTPSTSEAPQFPPPNPTPPPMPFTFPSQSQQQFSSYAQVVKSHTTPVIPVTIAPPRPPRAATDQVPSLFRDQIRPAEAKVIPTSPPSVPTPAQQQNAQASPAAWNNPAMALLNAFKVPAPPPERNERAERQERQEWQERERQEQIARQEQLEQQERAERQQRLERERTERQERLERERAERLERDRRERQERLERESVERERQEQLEREKVERERQERLEREKAERERQERLEREQREQQERLARQERLERERLERQERLERERVERQARLERDRFERDRVERNRLERERVERERLEKEQLEKERFERERLEREQLERQERAAQQERERLERERIEQERLARERTERTRIERERIERARIERERIERARIERERIEREWAERERLQRERIEQESVERERLEMERLEQARLERARERERLERERVEQERLAKQERAAQQERERLEQQERVIERERQELAEQQEKIERQRRADLQEKLEKQGRPERPERLDRHERLERYDTPEHQERELSERPPVPVRYHRQDSSSISLPASLPQAEPQAQVTNLPRNVSQSTVLPTPVPAPQSQSRTDSHDYVLVSQRREVQLPSSIQPPPAAYTANHVTHTGASDLVPAYSPPPEIQNEVVRTEVQRPAIVQPQPKKARSFTQLASLVRSSRSPSPTIVPQQLIPATYPKSIAALKAQEQDQSSLSFTRSVASSWKNSRSPSPFAHSSESMSSSLPKSNFVFHAQQVALPPSKGSSAKSSRASSPRAPSPQNDVVPLGQGLQIQSFNNPDRPSPSSSPFTRPRVLPAETSSRSYSTKKAPQTEVTTLVNVGQSAEVSSVPLRFQVLNTTKISEAATQPVEASSAPEALIRPRFPSKHVIPQYAPPLPPVTPAPPSTPVLEPKARIAAPTRSQLVPAIQAKCVPNDEGAPQTASTQEHTTAAAPHFSALTSRSVQPIVAPSVQRMAEPTVSGLKEEERKETPPPQMGLVTPPETPPTSFQESPVDRKLKRKSVPPSQDNIIRGTLLSTGKVRGPNESGPAAAPPSSLISRIPTSASKHTRVEEPSVQNQAHNSAANEALQITKPTASVLDIEQHAISKSDAHLLSVEEPPLPRDWRNVITRAVAPSDVTLPSIPLDYDENSSMLPPIKPVDRVAPTATYLINKNRGEKEQPTLNRMATKHQDHEGHVDSEPPVIPETVLPRKEDLVWQVMKSSLSVTPTAPQPQLQAEKARPAWTQSPWLDRPSMPSSAPSPRVYSPIPREEQRQLHEKPIQILNTLTPERQVNQLDEPSHFEPERTSRYAPSSAQVESYDNFYDRPSSTQRAEHSTRHHKGKEVEQIRSNDNVESIHQNNVLTTPPPAPFAKPIPPLTAQAVPPVPSPYRPISPEPLSNRPISPPPRIYSPDSGKPSNNGFLHQAIPTSFSLQDQHEPSEGIVHPSFSSPVASPRAVSPLPLPPQVQAQTKTARSHKHHPHTHNKRQAPHEEVRPPTPPLPSHYKKKRSYDVLPTDPSSFLKPATHILYPDTSSDCHSLIPSANASRPRLASQSQLRNESSLDTVGLQSKSARSLHSRRYTEKERGRRHTPYSPISDTQDEPESESDLESELENDLPSPPSTDSSHGEHRTRHLDDDPYTDVTIERATRGYHSKPVGRARAHTLTLPPSPSTAKDRHGRRRRSRSPTSSSGRSRSSRRPRATKPGRSQSEKAARGRGVSPLGRSRSSPLPSSRPHQRKGFWRSFGFWAMRFFARFKWGSASAPNSPVTVPHKRRGYDSDYY